METQTFQSLIIALIIGFASGGIGSFIILKRMALVGDALSHVALPGIALALAWSIDPFWGVLTFLLAAAVFVWWLEIKTKVPTEALVGILFTTSLAIGILTIPDPEIAESLFGAFPALSGKTLFVFIFIAASAVFLTYFFARHFLFRIISSDLSGIAKIGKNYDLIILILFSSIVALGIKLVGALLMGTLVIIPASIAKNLTKSIKGFLILSSALGGFIAIVGMFIAQNFEFPPGPAIVLFGAIIFLLSLSFVHPNT